MVKLIGGELWYCCPLCGQKLHEIAPWAKCTGVKTKCKRCKQIITIEIEGAERNGKRKENTG